ncbi:hemerythrin domain-containing protein [Nonomuraea sp. NPDC050663]|uniref:hemerythrin domain-containing protein n=1 Tax=Nonomuraea sp. NPDC050663 TaxID=3364370 RepID=UPI0037B7903E
MCDYCGCREMPLLKEFIAEHEAIYDTASDIRRALDHGEPAAELVGRLRALLAPHFVAEEDGLFQVMAGQEEYAGYVAALVDEHRELDAFLAAADLNREDDRTTMRQAVAHLWEHIRKEEDGLFPASVSALSAAEWDVAFEAWERVHPER